MKKVLMLVLISLISCGTQAQYNVVWGELLKTKGRVTSVFPLDGSDFYTLRFQGGALLGSQYLGNHTNFVLTNTGKILARVGNSTATIESINVVNGQPVVFLADQSEGKKILYMQKYTSACVPQGEAIELTQFTMPKGWRKKGDFTVQMSQNKEFICVEFDIPASRDEKQKFGYKVMTSELEVISEGDYELRYEQNEATISNRYLSNTGDYFIATKVYNASDKRKMFKDYTTLDKVLLMQVTPDGLEEFELDLDNKRIFDMSFSSDNNRIMTFTGLYGDVGKGESGIKGIFYFRLDFDKKEMIDQGFEPFKKDFITEGWSERQKEKADKKEAKGKAAPQLFNYDIRDIITLADGSILGMLEQYYVHVVTTTDNRGVTSYTYYYYYNDIIAYKVHPNGTFEWVKKIPKSQVSTNDYGYYSSIARFVTKDKIVLFFNDNLKNYDESGAWINNTAGDTRKTLYGASYRKKTNTVAKVEIDLADGTVDRHTFFDRQETNAYAIPKLFKTDYIKQEMLLVLRYGKKEKYGLLSFGE